MKTKLRQIMLDISKVLKIASIVFLVVLLAIGGISLIVYKGKLIPSLDIIRAVLFVIGGIGLIITSGLIIKNKSTDPIESKEEWVEKFKCIKFRTFMAIFSFTILIYGCIIDYIRYALK